jgi:hypothetical protein
MNIELPPDFFEQITGYRVSPMGPVADEKRVQSRVPLSRRALLTRWIKGQAAIAIAVMVREISVTGISVLASEQLKSREVFTIALPRREGEPVTVRCEVVRCEPGGTGRQMFVIGAAFVSNVSTPPIAGLTPADAEIHRIKRAMFAD